MIALPELGDDHHTMWIELFGLANAGAAPWTLIGGQMVALHGRVRDREPLRTSRDADLLADVRVVSRATGRISRSLVERGFELTGIDRSGVGHRFAKGNVRMDVLAPDHVGERVNLSTTQGARTIRVPGGTQALRRTVLLEMQSRDAAGTIPVPDVLGALLVKVRAIDVSEDVEVHRQDVGFLLTLIDDPDALPISSSERRWLRRHPAFADPSHPVWRGIRNAEDGAIVYRRLANM